MRRTLARPEASPYKTEIAERLWSVGAVLASYGDWRTADAAVGIARSLGKPPPAAGGKFFRHLARLHPKAALRLRESMVRLTKPHLRTH